MVIVYIRTGYIQVLYLGRAPHTKETLPYFVRDVGSPDIHECFRGLTGSQRTPEIWGVTYLHGSFLGSKMTSTCILVVVAKYP